MKLKTCNCRTQVAFTELYLAGILRYPGKDLSIIKYAHFYSIAHAAPAGLNKPWPAAVGPGQAPGGGAEKGGGGGCIHHPCIKHDYCHSGLSITCTLVKQDTENMRSVQGKKPKDKECDGENMLNNKIIQELHQFYLSRRKKYDHSLQLLT